MTIQPFKHVVSPGTNDEYGRLWIELRWQYLNGGMELSISAVEGPNKRGNCKGSCGQCRDSLGKVDKLSEGWTRDMLTELSTVWDRWHLNRMRAGSPAQESWLREHPVTAIYPESHYVKACEALAEAGLNPDPDYLHPSHVNEDDEVVSAPYHYGHAWLSEEVPDDIMQWLNDLPRGTHAEYPWHL